VLAVVGEATTMGAIERRLRCDRCGARFPRVGLQTPPWMTPYKGKNRMTRRAVIPALALAGASPALAQSSGSTLVLPVPGQGYIVVLPQGRRHRP
jgi:hypothetical protein